MCVFFIFPLFCTWSSHIRQATGFQTLFPFLPLACVRKTLLFWCLCCELQKSGEDRSQLSLYLYIKKIQLPLLIIMHFPLLLDNSEKGPCRCSLCFYVRSYLTDSRKCQPDPKVKKKRKKQPDYSVPWKVTCDTVSRKCKIYLYNIRGTQWGPSWSPASASKKRNNGLEKCSAKTSDLHVSIYSWDV